MTLARQIHEWQLDIIPDWLTIGVTGLAVILIVVWTFAELWGLLNRK